MNKETKLRARPAAIILTPAAEARIAELMGKAPEGAIGVKLSTPRRGCSGLAYSVDYVTKEQPFDEKIETPAGTFYVDGASVLYLIGSTIPWRDAHIIEALSQPIRAASVVIPGGLGTQEWGGVALCSLLGMPENQGATLWLLKRGRELVLDGVGLAYLVHRSGFWAARDD